MKHIKTLLTILFILLLSSPSWSVTFGDLMQRDGLFYKKFTDVPFTGEVTGLIALDNWSEQGSVKNGKMEGVWFTYHKDGQLKSKGNYNNGKKDGTWFYYRENIKTLWQKGNYKNDMIEGSWTEYYDNGQLYYRGKYKDWLRDGYWIMYWENGQLKSKGNYKRDNQEGFWIYYNENGNIWEDGTGTYENGGKISQ
jgi:antitoxin component YwqK of YwqJK toxin-antitoxin module